MSQFDLFTTADPPEIEASEDNMKARALDAVIRTSAQKGYNGFTCYDVKKNFPEIEFKNPKTWGSVLKTAMQQGHISNTMTVRAVDDPTSHNRPQAVWKGSRFK